MRTLCALQLTNSNFTLTVLPINQAPKFAQLMLISYIACTDFITVEAVLNQRAVDSAHAWWDALPWTNFTSSEPSSCRRRVRNWLKLSVSPTHTYTQTLSLTSSCKHRQSCFNKNLQPDSLPSQKVQLSSQEIPETKTPGRASGETTIVTQLFR